MHAFAGKRIVPSDALKKHADNHTGNRSSGASHVQGQTIASLKDQVGGSAGQFTRISRVELLLGKSSALEVDFGGAEQVIASGSGFSALATTSMYLE